MYANTNWDDEKNDRQKAIQELEANMDDTVATVYGKGEPELEEFEIDPNDPFWAAMYAGQAELDERMRAAGHKAPSEAVGPDSNNVDIYDVDQSE